MPSHLRYYDKRLRGFISRDPLEADPLGNLYSAIDNNPGSYTDPMGLKIVIKIHKVVDYWDGVGTVRGEKFVDVTDDEDDKFAKKIREFIKKLKGNGAMKKCIEMLEESDNIHVIRWPDYGQKSGKRKKDKVENESGARDLNGEGEGSTMFFNPFFPSGERASGIRGGSGADLFQVSRLDVFAHELVHMMQAELGTWNDDDKNNNSLSDNEEEAVNVQNKFRPKNKQRKKYSGKDVGINQKALSELLKKCRKKCKSEKSKMKKTN